MTTTTTAAACAQWVTVQDGRYTTTAPCECRTLTHRIAGTDKLVCARHARRTDVQLASPVRRAK